MSEAPETLVLQKLLLAVEGAKTPEARADAVRAVEQRYAAIRTVLVGDMQAFTSRVVEDGIVPFVGSIYRMRRLCSPVVAATAGYLFKAEADNLFAAFSDPQAALRCALAIQLAIAEDNRLRGPKDRISMGIGICSGEVLAIGVEDVWGHAINVASKLGEDVAEADEILVDDATYQATKPPGGEAAPHFPVNVKPDHIVISGVPLDFVRLTLRPGAR